MVFAERMTFRMQSIACWLHCNTKPPYRKHAAKGARTTRESSPHRDVLFTGNYYKHRGKESPASPSAPSVLSLLLQTLLVSSQPGLFSFVGAFCFISVLCDTSQEKLAQALH